MNRYRSLGLKLTPQRLAILDFLEGNTSHPSAESIYKYVSKKFPTISVATVYNTMAVLRSIGLIQELSIDPSRKRFDPNPEPHHHLICVKCSRVVDIHREFNLEIPIGERSGYEISGNQIDFYGLCPGCQKKALK